MFYKSNLKSEFSITNKILRAIWTLVYFLFFRFTIIPLNQWRGMILKLFGASIGKNVLIYPSAKIWAPWNLNIGDRVVIGPGVILYNIDNIIIGDDVTISQNSHLCTASHDIESLSRTLTYAPIVIGKGAWIFADAFVFMGIKIGEGAIVGARSVVTKTVGEFDVVAGNPAKFLKKRKVDWQINED